MKYSKGSVGRVFVVKLEHGDDLLQELISLIKKEDIQAGIVHFVGALERAEIVVGPEKVEIPPVPMWRSFQDGREVLGLGTIFWKGTAPSAEPMIHIHSGIGRDKNFHLGCIRKDAKTYLTIEAIIIELEGVKVKRQFDEKTQLNLLEFEG